MRLVLVGSPPERERLRAELDGLGADIVGEFTSFGAAQAAGLAADAIVVAGEASAEAGSYTEPLTPREVQVLELLAEGLPNKAIAERLGISDQTVKFHVASISGKLGASNRTDAVRRAVRRGLISL
jgi:DNA-binding NarL/FixJ family response regulator